MGTNAHLTTAQGLYIPNPTHMGSNGMDSGYTASGDYSIAMGSSFANGGNLTPKWGMLIEKLELKLYRQSIRIIQLENKLTPEECDNLRKILMSNDTSSVIVAKEIIDNLETGEYD
jgi:hypothetical protein